MGWIFCSFASLYLRVVVGDGGWLFFLIVYFKGLEAEGDD